MEAHPVIEGERLVLRPLASERMPEVAARIAGDTVTAEWWGTDAEATVRWLGDPSVTAFMIEVDGGEAGMLMYSDSGDPDYRYASFDIAVFGAYAGQGIGPEAIRTLARWLVTERGHHRFHIDPAVGNARAIRAYEKVGFRPVGVLRKYERMPDGTFRDGLLMDLLAEEIAAD